MISDDHDDNDDGDEESNTDDLDTDRLVRYIFRYGHMSGTVQTVCMENNQLRLPFFYKAIIGPVVVWLAYR